MLNNYNFLKNNELKETISDWSFSKEMQKASRNPMWKNKTGLWTLLSGICDDAALKCYQHINKFSRSLIDIDTCNIHALKSIAASVDLSYLCKHISEDYPHDMLELINLFSVPKYYLMNKNDIIDENSNDPLMGEIFKRIKNVSIDEVNIDVLLNIVKYSIDIKKILNLNMVFTRKSLKELLKTDLKDLKISDENEEILSLSLNKIFDKIIYFNESSLHDYKIQQLYVNNNINYFYLLINVIKQNIYNSEFDFFIEPVYFNKEKNKNVNLRWLFIDIVNVLTANNKFYVKYFICFHFYNLLCSKLKNENLKEMFYLDEKLNLLFIKNDLYKEYDKDTFISLAKNILNEDELKQFLNLIYSNFDKDSTVSSFYFNHYILEFIKYLKYVNNFIEKYNKDIFKKIDYDIAKINFPQKFQNNYENILFGNEFDESTKKNSGILMKVAKELTDITLNISYIRKQIKTSILQYNFIGTERIASDIFTDFFLKNYSNSSDWDFISDEETNIVNEYEKDIIKPLSSLIEKNNKNKRFSIDIIEYYDTTKYLNIESDLGDAYAGTYISRVEEKPKYYIDENNLITSSMVSSNVYEDAYVPCSYFFKDYNERFWENDINVIGEFNNYDDVKFNNYDKFYSQFITNSNNTESNNYKKDFIENELNLLLSNIWDTFSLSGYDPNDTSDISKIGKKYIGNDDGYEKFKNLKNKYFPTIAPIQNIDGLIKTSDIDKDNVLYLAKIYYSEVFESILQSTIQILNMNDKNGIPFEDWKQKYVDFHGYSTYYESSNNMSVMSNISNKYFDFDGPWSYSLLQKTIFDKLNNKTDFSYLTKYIDIEDNEKFSLDNIYYHYINDENIFLNKDINNKNIKKIENDIYDNVFTLFNNENNNYSGLYFRTCDMPLSVPISNNNAQFSMFEFNKSNKDLYDEFDSLFNNCIDFGISLNLLWIFSKTINNKFKLVSFKYDIKYNHIFIDENTIRYYYFDNFNKNLNSINDFIGVDYNNEILNIFMFNSFDMLYKFSNSYNSKNKINLFNFDLQIVYFKLNLNTDELKKNIINVKNSVCPSILYHNNYNEINFDFFDNSHNIWNIEKFNNRYYICYEALNYSLFLENKHIFDYYYSLSKKSIIFENVILEYSINNKIYLNDKNNLEYFQYMKMYYSNDDKRLMYDQYDSNNDLINNIIDFYFKFPDKNFKNNSNSISLIPISLFYNFNDKNILKIFFKNLLHIYNILKPDKISFDFINDHFNEIFNLNLLNIDNKKLNIIINEIKIFRNQLSFILNNIKMNNDKFFIKMTFDSINQNSEIINNKYYLSNDFFKNMPIIERYFFSNLNITVWFKNNTNIKFLNSNVNDLDIACYINDEVEKYKKIGYGNNYNKTKYISWKGDNIKNNSYNDNESISIDVASYINDNKNNKNNIMQIILNTCWFNESEIKDNNVYATINYNNITQNIKLNLNGINVKSCNEKSLVLNIDMNTKILTYETPKLYVAIKITLKKTLVGFSDGISDIQVGLINLTKSELNNLSKNKKWYDFDNHLIFKNNRDNLNYKYVTILLKDGIELITSDDLIRSFIIMKLHEVFKYFDIKLNKKIKYDKLYTNEIYFGYLINNIDKETNINYVYSSFLKPRKFSKKETNENKYQIFNFLDKNILISLKDKII